MATPDNNLIRLLQGLQHACQKAAPSLQSAVDKWHSRQKQILKISPCTQPNICCRVTGKPTSETSCAECVKWVTCIETVYYPQPSPPNKPHIAWKNIDSSLLYNSTIQVCNGFALNLPSDHKPTQISDYDTASILKIMMGFGEFHHNNQGVPNFRSPHQTILEVRY